jgi:hypothetical protein
LKLSKEKIETLKFPHSEVLEDDSAIKERTNALKEHFRNLEHLQIYFEDGLSKKCRNYSLKVNCICSFEERSWNLIIRILRIELSQIGLY